MRRISTVFGACRQDAAVDAHTIAHGDGLAQVQIRVVGSRTLHEDVSLLAGVVHMIDGRKVDGCLQVAVSHRICPCVAQSRHADVRVDIDDAVQVVLVLIGTEVYVITEALFACRVHTQCGNPSQVIYIIGVGILGQVVLIEVIATLVQQSQRWLQTEVACLDVLARCGTFLRVGEVRTVDDIVVHVGESHIVVLIWYDIERIVGDIGPESRHGIVREDTARLRWIDISRHGELRAVASGSGIVAPEHTVEDRRGNGYRAGCLVVEIHISLVESIGVVHDGGVDSRHERVTPVAVHHVIVEQCIAAVLAYVDSTGGVVARGIFPRTAVHDLALADDDLVGGILHILVFHKRCRCL